MFDREQGRLGSVADLTPVRAAAIFRPFKEGQRGVDEARRVGHLVVGDARPDRQPMTDHAGAVPARVTQAAAEQLVEAGDVV